MDVSYRIAHGAPGLEGAPLWDLTQNGVYPADVYSRPDWYLHGHESDWDAWHRIRSSRNKPEKRWPIFRAVPKGVRVINPGDWIAITREYAKDHARANRPEDDMVVIEARAPASSLFTSGDSLQEWGYTGPALAARVVVRGRRVLSEEQKKKKSSRAAKARRLDRLWPSARSFFR